MNDSAWRRALSDADLGDLDTTALSEPQLAADIARRLDRLAGAEPGFAAFSVPTPYDFTGLLSQQRQLMWTVWSLLEAADHTLPRAHEVRLNHFIAQDGHLPTELTGGRRYTIKSIHFDPHSIVFSHCYPQICGGVGGEVTVVDVEGYLRAHRLPVNAAFAPSLASADRGRMLIRPEHREAILTSFAHTLRSATPGRAIMVLIRNDPYRGVAHQIEPVTPYNGQKVSRKFTRCSVAKPH